MCYSCYRRHLNRRLILKELDNAPWYTRDEEIHEYPGMPTVADEIERYGKPHATRIALHLNPTVHP